MEPWNARTTTAAEIDVADAARRLGIDPSRVRQLLLDNRLEGRRLGGRWLVPADAVARFAAQRHARGRPMAPARAWGLLDLIDHGTAPWLSPVARSQVRARGRDLVDADAGRWRDALRARNTVHRCSAPERTVAMLLRDPRARPAAKPNVESSEPPRVYVDTTRWSQLADSSELGDVIGAANADIVVLVAEPWPFAGRSEIGRAARAADLLDTYDAVASESAVATLNDLGARVFGRARPLSQYS